MVGFLRVRRSFGIDLGFGLPPGLRGKSGRTPQIYESRRRNPLCGSRPLDDLLFRIEIENHPEGAASQKIFLFLAAADILQAQNFFGSMYFTQEVNENTRGRALMKAGVTDHFREVEEIIVWKII